MSIFVIKECNYGHDHSHTGHQHAHGEYKEFGYRFFLNLGFAVIEIVGEYGPIRWLLFPMRYMISGMLFYRVSYFLERYSRKKRP